MERVLIAGGGTGGHLFPGLAVVEELRRRVASSGASLEVTFVGTAKGIEARVLPPAKEKLELLEVTPLKGRSAGELLASLMRLPRAYARCVSILRAARPDVVIGVGGYASGPMLVAARSMGIPTALLEQNAYVGMTNRLLAPIVGRAYVTFEETRAVFGDKARVVGNPVRRAFVDAARIALADPAGFEARARKVLVVGGSQGAQHMNEVIPGALARTAGASGLEVVHQTGAAMLDAVRARYAELGVRAEVVPFIEDMARAYAGAQLVIARAGATTLAEICAIGRPAVLVPYPHAADDHQTKNAEALERAGAAVMVRDAELEETKLGETLSGLLADDGRRAAMARAAREHGRPEAAASIVDDLLSWLGGPAMRPLTVPVRVRGGSGASERRSLLGAMPVPAARFEPFGGSLVAI
ncbi:MAG: undecaprenyldiphospho-muramoylpentapeptide beta-N-acetylglucosaminyltransferase [Sandaracinus sp.]